MNIDDLKSAIKTIDELVQAYFNRKLDRLQRHDDKCAFDVESMNPVSEYSTLEELWIQWDETTKPFIERVLASAIYHDDHKPAYTGSFDKRFQGSAASSAAPVHDDIDKAITDEEFDKLLDKA